VFLVGSFLTFDVMPTDNLWQVWATDFGFGTGLRVGLVAGLVAAVVVAALVAIFQNGTLAPWLLLVTATIAFWCIVSDQLHLEVMLEAGWDGGAWHTTVGGAAIALACSGLAWLLAAADRSGTSH
jgi:hypothetical protein